VQGALCPAAHSEGGTGANRTSSREAASEGMQVVEEHQHEWRGPLTHRGEVPAANGR
jgi:hypothetical protein